VKKFMVIILSLLLAACGGGAESGGSTTPLEVEIETPIPTPSITQTGQTANSPYLDFSLGTISNGHAEIKVSLMTNEDWGGFCVLVAYDPATMEVVEARNDENFLIFGYNPDYNEISTQPINPNLEPIVKNYHDKNLKVAMIIGGGVASNTGKTKLFILTIKNLKPNLDLTFDLYKLSGTAIEPRTQPSPTIVTINNL